MREFLVKSNTRPVAGPLSCGKIELLKFPYPYEAAVTVASDADSGSLLRFKAIHSLLCGRDVIRSGTPEWRTLGLTPLSAWYSEREGGVQGLGLDFADSFFLFADDSSMGMFRESPDGQFYEDLSDGFNAAEAIRGWLKTGQIDSFHSFLHYPRERVLPVIESFYRWCEQEDLSKPSVWINHSMGATPTGLCPRFLRPNRTLRFARMTARAVAGPLFRRKRRPLRQGLVWYAGATPGSRYYINDILAANGLRYIWLNVDDLLINRIGLPERSYGGRLTILEPLTMDDGAKYYRFSRCSVPIGAEKDAQSCLRQSLDTCDTSRLFTRQNLDQLCLEGGSCILYTHFTHRRSFPIDDDTIGRFHLLRQYRDDSRVWVLPLAKLLEWTRVRTFLKYGVSEEKGCLLIDIQGVEDPLFGKDRIDVENLRGLSFRVSPDVNRVVIASAGRPLDHSQYHFREGVYSIL